MAVMHGLMSELFIMSAVILARIINTYNVPHKTITTGTNHIHKSSSTLINGIFLTISFNSPLTNTSFTHKLGTNK